MPIVPSTDFLIRLSSLILFLLGLGGLVSCSPSEPEVITWPESLPLIKRVEWATESVASPEDIVAMTEIRRITIHHDGMKPGPMESDAQIRYRVVSIRNSHSKKYADIAYHFVVDPKGKVWEGRPLEFQGAHVKGQNEGNVGILFLGNSQSDKPTEAGLEALFSLVHYFMKRHKVAPDQIFTHGELGQTGCPGKLLQAQIDLARKNEVFLVKSEIRKIRTGIDWAKPGESFKELLRKLRGKIGF